MRSFYALTMVLALGCAARADNGLCSLQEGEVLDAPQCVRWFFACKADYELHHLRQPAPSFAGLPLRKRQELLLTLTAEEANKKCARFSYEEAEAARRHILRTLPPFD